MSTILIVDDAAVCREPIAAALREHGFRTLEAAGGDEALAVLREEQPDLMLLDLAMPQPDGLAVLRAIRRNPTFKSMPVILLTDCSDREQVMTAAERGIQGYLLKSQFSLEELFRRVDQCLKPADTQPIARARRPGPDNGGAASAERAPQAGDDHSATLRRLGARSLETLEPVISRQDLIRLVNQGLELRPLGPVVGQVLAVTGNAQCSADEVAKVVMQDQALSIRLLKLANSSAYSRGHSVDSIKDAVQRIGTNEVRSLVMTLGVVEQYPGAIAEHVDPRLFWEHSIACGLIASAIAESRRASNTDDYFLWGVLHDVGRIIMLDHAPDAYISALEAARALDLPLERVEPRLMLLDHCDIIERAMEFWQFPKEFIIPVVNHHQPLARIKRLGPEHQHAAATVALADRLAHAMLLGGSGNEVIHPIDEFLDYLALKAPVLRRIEETVADEVANLKLVMLARAADGEWPNGRQKAINGLEKPLAPLFASANAEVDSFRMVLDRLRANAELGQSNLGVLHFTRINEQQAVCQQYQEQEKQAGCENLPLLIISGKGGVDEEKAFLKSRRHVTLPAPIRVPTMIAAINGLSRGPA